MRSYPCNSPEAAARIVALVLIADGHVCRSEFEALQRIGVAGTLGLEPDTLHRDLQDLCEDLLGSTLATGSMTASIDAETLASLLREIDDPSLQVRVLELADAAARADRYLAEGEATILAAAVQHWGLEEAAGRAAPPSAERLTGPHGRLLAPSAIPAFAHP